MLSSTNYQNLEIVIYSINYSEELLKQLPYISYFVERSLCHLKILLRPHVCVVIITPSLVDSYIFEYHFQDLYQMNSEHKASAYQRLIKLFPESQEKITLSNLVINDDSIISRLKEELNKAESVEIISCAPCKQIDFLGEQLNIAVQECPEDLSCYWGSKAGSKDAFFKSGVSTPRGTIESFKNIDDIKEETFRLAKMNPPSKNVVIKLNDGSWGNGLGNVIIDCDKLFQTNDLSQSIESSMQSWENLVPEILQGGAIVEEYLKGVTCSPSGQGFIDKEGNVKMLSIHDQILVGSQYMGCIFPASTEYLSKINETIEKVGRTLYTNGVCGTFGIDFIVVQDGELLATEINLGKVVPSHAFSYVESVIGNSVSSDGMLRNKNGLPIHYVHRRLYEPSLLKYLEPQMAVETLRSSGLLYEHNTQTGTILHILGALKLCGYIEITSVEKSREKAFELDKQVKLKLFNIAKSLIKGSNGIL